MPPLIQQCALGYSAAQDTTQDKARFSTSIKTDSPSPKPRLLFEKAAR